MLVMRLRCAVLARFVMHASLVSTAKSVIPVMEAVIHAIHASVANIIIHARLATHASRATVASYAMLPAIIVMHASRVMLARCVILLKGRWR